MQQKKLLAILKRYPKAISYYIEDIKAISSSICTHIILMEEDYRLEREHQMRFNPNMKEVLPLVLFIR